MAHSNIDISALILYNKDGRQIDLAETANSDGTSYLSGKIYCQPLSIALYDNQNFYLLKKSKITTDYVGGSTSNHTDLRYRDFINNVPNIETIKVGQEIQELSSTGHHIDYDASSTGIGWSPVYVADVDIANSKLKMSKPAIADGSCDFKTVEYGYVFPGDTVGDMFTFKWVKKSKGVSPQGWPYLNDELHYVGEYRIYKNKLYKCLVQYTGKYLSYESNWKEVSVNTDEHGFFVYDVLVDTQNYPYIEKVIDKKITYSSEQVDFRYPMEFNVAFNPTEEMGYENVLEIWYQYAVDGVQTKIIELSFYGEGVMEDDRISTWLSNFGIKFNKSDAMMVKDYDLKECVPDWNVINSTMKQMFFNKEQIFPYIGTYKGLANMISILGFKDILHVKEYWINKNPQSGYFNKMLLVDISDMLDDGKIQNASVLEFNRIVKFDDAMQKTGYLALSYEFTSISDETDADGIPIVVETSDMTPSEVFYKLNKLKTKLKNEFLPTNVVISDIIGEFVYFQKVTPTYWYDQTKIFNNEIAEDVDISLYPTGMLYMRNIESLYERTYENGAAFPIYTFNAGGSNPYESNQNYNKTRMSGLTDTIRNYYNKVLEHDSISIDNDYYWESGDDSENPVGCPVILNIDITKLTLEDLHGKKLSDFSIGSNEYSQSFFTVVEHEKVLPSTNQWSEVTISPIVSFGHIYTHNISINGVTHSYTYTSKMMVEVTADATATSIEFNDGTTTVTYSYSGALTADLIVDYLVTEINNSGQSLSANNNFDGSFNVYSSVTDPFYADAIANCVITGDTAIDIASGMVDSINDESGSPQYIYATLGLAGTYVVTAASIDDWYVNMFESAASYYTLENIDYLNMYEIEWNILKRDGGQPYSFTWRGKISDLHEFPHILPYVGEYDVSAKLFDFMGGATIAYKPRLITVKEPALEIIAFSKYEDKFEYSLSNLGDVLIDDFGSSEIYDPNVIMRDFAVSIKSLKVGLMDWYNYRNNMYAYDAVTGNGIKMWDTTLAVPAFVPLSQCNHPRKDQWGINDKFILKLSDFEGARIEDVYFWKLKNMVYAPDFLAGFHMWNPAPFDIISFGTDSYSPSIEKIKYVIPNIVTVKCASTIDINTHNVNTIDGIALSVGDTVLLNMQTNSDENGVYVAFAIGTHYGLSREPLCDTAYKTANTAVIVEYGNTHANSFWKPNNYLTTQSNSFFDSPMDYYKFEYDAASDSLLCDIINSEKHPIMSLFSADLLADMGSPAIDIIHVTSREFEKQSYQYLTYIKNTDMTLFPYILVDVIGGSEYTFFEPEWTYSKELIDSLYAEYGPFGSPVSYKHFKKEELFLDAPIMDILNGNTNDMDYFINNEYLSVEDKIQVGHLPSVVDENYLSMTMTKAFSNGFVAPKHSILFFNVNNIFAKCKYEWRLYDDVTGEEIVRVNGVPFFVWKFNEHATYRLEIYIYDKNENYCEIKMSNFIHIESAVDYKNRLNVLNSHRKDHIVQSGFMYNQVMSVPGMIPPDASI